MVVRLVMASSRSSCSCEQRQTQGCAEMPARGQRDGGARYRATSGRGRDARRINSTTFLLAAALLLLLACLPSGNALSLDFMFGSSASFKMADLPPQCDHTMSDTAAGCSEVGRDAATCSQCLAGEWCRPVNVNGTAVVDMAMDGNASVVCEPCPAGCFQSVPGQMFCLVCHSGNFSSACNQSSCERCLPGHFTPRDNQSHVICEECAVGMNQTRPGKIACDRCPANHMCNNTACDHCQKCPSGAEAFANRTACQPCAAGEYNPGFLDDCHLCAPGSASNLTGRAMCEPCDIGHFARHYGEKACAQCPLGHYQDQMGEDMCPRCRRGHYATQMASPTCTECGVGFYCPTADNPPMACPKDAFCPKGSEAPQYCPAMYNLNASQNGCAMSGGLIGIIAATLLANIIIVTVLIWHYYRKKRLYTGLESQPLVWRKETLSRDPPVYDGF